MASVIVERLSETKQVGHGLFGKCTYCDMHAVGLRNRCCLVTARQATEEVAVNW
jgi:hypothetical protein